jgi:hypothetical protein
MNKRGAVQKLNTDGRRIGDAGTIFATGFGDSQTKARPHPGAAWKHGVSKSCGELGWSLARRGTDDRRF